MAAERRDARAWRRAIVSRTPSSARRPRNFRRSAQPGKLADIPYSSCRAAPPVYDEVQTACERLHTTPTPFTYTLLLHRTAWLFCLFLPFGLVGTVGLATPVLTAILAYSFFGLDALGEELEEPFGGTQNALPLDAIVRNIEIAVGEALGDATLPEPLKPKNFILD